MSTNESSNPVPAIQMVWSDGSIDYAGAGKTLEQLLHDKESLERSIQRTQTSIRLGAAPIGRILTAVSIVLVYVDEWYD